MKNTLTVPDTTRLEAFIKEMGTRSSNQIKAIATFVAAIIAKQTGCQAELARTQGNQETPTKRLSRLIHNARLSPKDFIEWLCCRVLEQAPRTGQVRVTIDWTSEDNLRVTSLVVGRRALPIFWCAYDQTVLKGRMKRYERAVLKRAFKLIFEYVEPRRLKLTADRGFPDDDLFELLDPLGVFFILRVKGSVKVEIDNPWRRLNSLRFAGNAQRRNLGRLAYCESKPRQVWSTMSRTRNKHGHWEVWYRVSNRPLRAKRMAAEWGYRFCCEEGFRDAK